VVEFGARAYVEGDDEGMPMTATTETTITRNDAESRYEIHIDDVLAGFTVFRIDTRGRLIFPHTEVDPAFRGRGVAQQLVAGAMADVAQRGETVIPHCPVVSGYLRKNEVPGLDIIWPTHPHPE
jgi:predicted GNAT family acetyltransferase